MIISMIWISCKILLQPWESLIETIKIKLFQLKLNQKFTPIKEKFRIEQGKLDEKKFNSNISNSMKNIPTDQAIVNEYVEAENSLSTAAGNSISSIKMYHFAKKTPAKSKESEFDERNIFVPPLHLDENEKWNQSIEENSLKYNKPVSFNIYN